MFFSLLLKERTYAPAMAASPRPGSMPLAPPPPAGTGLIFISLNSWKTMTWSAGRGWGREACKPGFGGGPAGLTLNGNPLMMNKLAFRVRRPAETGVKAGSKTGRPDSRHSGLLPPRSMVGQLTLDQHIGVRIPGGQPNIESKAVYCSSRKSK